MIGEDIRESLHHRFGLSVKVAKHFIRSPAAEKLDGSCVDVSLEKCSRTGAAKGTDGRKLVRRDRKVDAAKEFCHEAIGDGALCAEGIVVDVKWGVRCSLVVVAKVGDEID